MTKRPSRQSSWQLRKHRQGRCIICGKGPLETSYHCAKHAQLHRERSLARYHARKEEAR